MVAWLTGLSALLLGLVCGWQAPRAKWAKPLIAGITALLFVVMLFGLLIIMWPDFRRLFSYPVQFYGGLGVRHGLLAAGELAGGWILCEGLRKKRGFYILVGILFLFAVPIVYERKWSHDYSTLDASTNPMTVTKQTDNYTCAAASLSNLTALLGAKISERQAAEMMGLDHYGGAVWQVAYVLQHLGYSFQEIRTESMADVKFPALIIVRFSDRVDHAVLVTGRAGPDYAVIDPLAGSLTYSAKWFADRWCYQGVMDVHR